MVFKLSVAYVIALFALMSAFTGVCEHNFYMRGVGKDMMRVPDKSFKFYINPGSPSNYPVYPSYRPVDVSVGGCVSHMTLSLDEKGKIVGQGDTSATKEMCANPSSLYVCSGTGPSLFDSPYCKIKYVSVAPSGYNVEMEVSGEDVPSDFEIYSDYTGPVKSPTTQSTTTVESTTSSTQSITTVEPTTTTTVELTQSTVKPTSSISKPNVSVVKPTQRIAEPSIEPTTTEVPTDSTQFPQTWHIVAISVGLLLLSLLSAVPLLFIVWRRRKKSKEDGEDDQADETEVGPSPNAFDPRVINLPTKVSKPKISQPAFQVASSSAHPMLP